MSLESKYPREFFNIPHPTSPVVNIQFRTKITDENISDSGNWESITFDPSNFFDNLALEDASGFYNLKLRLKDINSSYLENLIIRTLTASRMANQLIKNPSFDTDSPQFFQFTISNTTSANLRIRFGYSESYNDDFIDVANMESSDWRSRTANTRSVMKTPWLYFQISKSDMKYTSSGFSVDIEAFSVMNSFLNRAKLIESYSRLFGEPKFVIEQIGKKITEAAKSAGDNVEIVIQDEPFGFFSQEDGKEMIEVMLGGEPIAAPDGTYRINYRPIGRILDDICSKVRPIKVDSTGRVIPENRDSSADAEGELGENEEAAETYPYGYFVNATEEKTQIVFYYKNPLNSFDRQNTCRVYSWLFDDGTSVVRDLDISASTDFATLNLPIAIFDRVNGEIRVSVARGKSADLNNSEDVMDFSVGNLTDVSEAFNKDNFEGAFVFSASDMDRNLPTNGRMSSSQLGAMLSSKVVDALNQQIFRGSVTIQGDPFYLFDGQIQPFTYLIKLIINKPSFINENGDFVQGEKSYLSGYYAITKITHTIARGYTTQLELMKWNSHGK